MEVVKDVGLITCESGEFARGQDSSVGRRRSWLIPLALLTLEMKVLVRVQVECGREEVNDGEKQEKDKHEETDNRTDNQTLIMDGMKME